MLLLGADVDLFERAAVDLQFLHGIQARDHVCPTCTTIRDLESIAQKTRVAASNVQEKKERR